MQQHKKEAIDNDTRSKLDHHIVLRIGHICEFLAIEVKQLLNQKPCSSSTNTENVAAQNGRRGIWKRDLLRQYFSVLLANIDLEILGNNIFLVNYIFFASL